MEQDTSSCTPWQRFTIMSTSVHSPGDGDTGTNQSWSARDTMSLKRQSSSYTRRAFSTPRGRRHGHIFFVSNNRRRRPWHGHVAILNCPKLIMSDHGTCDDSSFGIFNWPSFNQSIYIYTVINSKNDWSTWGPSHWNHSSMGMVPKVNHCNHDQESMYMV